MEKILKQLRADHPALRFSVGKQFCWSPETKEIFYKIDTSNHKAIWSLLHETGHALLEHASYEADFQLIRMEMAAWEKAKELAGGLDTIIDENHIQDCLDTYRDWLYKRSICPTCRTKCLQQNDYAHYRCFNCHTVWKVTPSRFCRTYRSTKNIAQPAIFHLYRD